MLFDLRSRRRRRVVKSVYLFLALLIGIGLVGFGVGTGGSFGGLFNAASTGGGTPTGEVSYAKALAKAEKRAAKQPSSAAAWLAVGEAAYSLSQLYYVPSSTGTGGGFTASGFQVLAKLQKAWTNYINLDPSNPSSSFANEVALSFGTAPTGIEHYRIAESAQEIVAESEQTVDAYLALCDYAYLADEPSRAELAADRALALAPEGQRKAVESAIAGYKASYDKQHGIGATGASGATGTT